MTEIREVKNVQIGRGAAIFFNEGYGVGRHGVKRIKVGFCKPNLETRYYPGFWKTVKKALKVCLKGV